MKKLIDKLDKVFSEYIRRKDADENGINRCYTSGQYFHWKQLQCGHYLSRRYLSIRWDVNNARPQSVKENIFNQGNQAVFGENLKKEIGPEEVEKLNIKKNNVFKKEKFILEYLIKEYQTKLKNL